MTKLSCWHQCPNVYLSPVFIFHSNDCTFIKFGTESAMGSFICLYFLYSKQCMFVYTEFYLCNMYCTCIISAFHETCSIWDIAFLFFQYKILLYTLDGRCVSKFSAYDNALGIKSLAWSPTSQFLALGSYDEKVVNSRPIKFYFTMSVKLSNLFYVFTFL